MPIQPLRILLLEDSPQDAELIRERLAADGLDSALRLVRSREEFTAALGADPPEVILSAFSLPGFDGLSALDVAQRTCPDVPVLFVSGPVGEERAVEAVRSGAADFVLSARPERLVPALRQALQKARERAGMEQRRRDDRWAEEVRRRDEFMARLSHELRNPLAPIVNALYLLRVCSPPDPALREAREVIERQVGRLAHLVDDLTDVLKLAQRRLVLRRERLDLTRLVGRAAEDQRPLLRAAGIELVAEMPGALWVVGDAARLAQAVGNLIQNAAACTPRGGRVTVVSAAGAGGRVRVEVRDTGSGFAADLLPYVFDAFVRAGAFAEHDFCGLGLELMLVKGVVEAHGGEVHASSAGPGQGRELGFWLPLSAEEGPAEGALPAGARAQRILVVEDNKDAARTLRILLTRNGHEVALAYTGREGVAAARDWQPDVVLCDLGLPELDGFEVARVLRRQPETASCRLIAISGYGQDEDRRSSREAGFDLHLTKPVDPAELQRVLASLANDRL